MKDKIRFILPMLILFVIIAAYFIYLLSYVQPKIDFGAQITKISSIDYQRILENKQVISQDNGMEKFRHISVEIKVTTPFAFGFISSVKIERDLFHKYFENDDRIQILSGGGFEHSNGLEYAENIEIYLKDISEEDLRIVIKDFKVNVTWQSIWHSQNNEFFYLRDYLR